MVYVKIGESTILGLIDSGSQVNIADSKLLECIDTTLITPTQFPSGMHIISACQSKSYVTDAYVMPIAIGDICTCNVV